MSDHQYEITIAGSKEEIERLEKTLSTSKQLHMKACNDNADLIKENKKLRECADLLRDFISTKECQRTWVNEMQGTIEAVLEELDSIK